jgi:hypothetical protein
LVLLTATETHRYVIGQEGTNVNCCRRPFHIALGLVMTLPSSLGMQSQSGNSGGYRSPFSNVVIHKPALSG